jgi:beta-phosphoglucomutase-like phosphatase (HAD superfamily)
LGPPAALVFDLDGLLIASEDESYTVTSSMLARYGAPSLSRAEYAQFVGVAVAESWLILHRRHGLAPSVDALLAEHNREMLGWYRAPTLLHGAAELVEAAFAAGIPLGIASSAPGELVNAAVDGMAIGCRFATAVSADHPDVGAPKPAPDIYAVACGELGVEPAEALAIEDSPTGVRAALAAGLRAIVVPNDWTAAYDFPDGVRRVRDLRQLGAELGLTPPIDSRSA